MWFIGTGTQNNLLVERNEFVDNLARSRALFNASFGGALHYEYSASLGAR